MKRFMLLLLTVSLLACLSACGEKEAQQDTRPITMSVANGSLQTYFLEIQKAVKRDLNIDLEFVYQYSTDTSNSLVNEFKNDDLCADIMVTAAAVDNDYLKDTCLDYLTNSHITDYFTYSKVKEYTAEDGCVYQLPFTSKLIGVTYNKTLMEEMGWEVPSNYSELLDLKQKCEENDILFAVSGGFAAGHGFNWLFHLMGADWLSTLDGTEWFENFVKGEATVEPFAEKAQYFKKYCENGLFGEFYTADWNSSNYYKQQRALFNYDLTNSFSRAIRLNEDGTIYGAEYDQSGNVVATENNSGSYVYVNDTWDVYDENNILHQDTQRYDIPGAAIDEFAAMPWVSEDGSNNRYTCYDTMLLMLNKKLGEPEQKERLEDVLKILEYMCTEDATEHFSDTNLDGYVAVNNFKIDENRTYAAFADEVTAGYIQPWYYILVDTDTIYNVGYAANDFMAGGGTTYEEVMQTLNQSVKDHVNQVTKPITTISETFTYGQLAELLAYVGADDLQNKLNENNIEQEITASLMPYTENTGDMAPWSVESLGLVSTKLYAGDLDEYLVGTIISPQGNAAQAIEMTGAELNAIIESGLDRSAGGENYDASYGPYPYAVVTKNNEPIDESETYLVAVNERSLNEETYQSFLDSGKVLTDSEGNAISGDLKTAMIEYFKATSTITPGNISWQ